MPDKRKFSDQLNRVISVSFPPTRIISLVPSHTELLFDLGLERELVGITKFCIHPSEKVKQVEKVGGTKQVNINKVIKLNPDLIIANKEENTKSEIEELILHFPVWISNIHTLDDSLDMIRSIGGVTNRSEAAERMANDIHLAFKALELPVVKQKLRVAYFIWKDPLMLAGKETFIDNILSLAGFDNAFSLSRYPVISEDDLQKAAPDLIFLSSEPYPFREKHLKIFELLCPNAKVVLVDGEMFSWYGSRMKLAPAYLQKLFLEIF